MEGSEQTLCFAGWQEYLLMAQSKSEIADSASPQDPRIESRTATVFRPVLVETEGFAGFCLVRNISSNGLMGEVYTVFAADTAVTLQFEAYAAIEGQIRWCKDGRVGIEFLEPIDVASLLSTIASKSLDGKVNRAPRLPIQSLGEIIFDGRPIPIKLQNISQKGLMVQAKFLQPGEEVVVQLDGMPSRKAVVRWTQDGIAGLNFISLIPFAELAEWCCQTKCA